MARIITCGFEAQSASEWAGTEGTAPTFSTGVRNSGTASVRFQNTTSSARSIRFQVYADDTVGSGKNVYIRAYIRLDAAPAARTAILAWDDATGVGTGSFYCIKVNPDCTLIATASGGTSGAASSALTLGAWYRLEMNYDGAAHTLTPYLNGSAWATAISADLGGGHWARFGVINPTTLDLYFDDIAVNDASGGSPDNGLPGAVPASQVSGHVKAWSGSAWTFNPVKVWNGTTWTTKPLKRWSGSTWL
ncbi:hypothetical protein [Streptomyces microflavus]|uniref:hypothetical protein n=1 Tax=Streptomyces microflavus TaxID=1919 RepID=UPI0033BF2DD6